MFSLFASPDEGTVHGNAHDGRGRSGVGSHQHCGDDHAGAHEERQGTGKLHIPAETSEDLMVIKLH